MYDLLEEIRKRPGMYLGHFGDNSFKCLQSYLHALWHTQYHQMKEHSFWEFGRWVSGRLENWSVSLPFYQLEEELGNDAAFERYFELLDEYKNCKAICLEKAIIHKNHKANFYVVPPDDIYGRLDP